MDFKLATVLGVVMAAVVISSASFVWVFSVSMVSPVSMALVIILSLTFGWIYFGKEESTAKEAMALGIFWIIIAIILEAAAAVGFFQQSDYFKVNPSIYAGYLLMLVFTVAAFFLRRRLGKSSEEQAEPGKDKEKEMAMRGEALLEPSIAS